MPAFFRILAATERVRAVLQYRRMKTTVSKFTSVVDDIIEVATLGAVKSEPQYRATVSDEGRSATATSNDKQAAVASALDKLHDARRK